MFLISFIWTRVINFFFYILTCLERCTSNKYIWLYVYNLYKLIKFSMSINDGALTYCSNYIQMLWHYNYIFFMFTFLSNSLQIQNILHLCFTPLSTNIIFYVTISLYITNCQEILTKRLWNILYPYKGNSWMEKQHKALWTL